ncbi:MAG: hypothetical protein GXY53_09135 [Desulfobulbus sp.]|nr:hypothetical protein [Desulfobulbus sp.]
MKKTTLFVLVFSVLSISLQPSAAWSRHHCCSGIALGWGLTGLFLGSALTALAYQPPPPVYPPPPPVAAHPITAYAPVVPPGMCRWERYVLDPYGRVLFDRYGYPIKEYTIGSCHYPPY